MKKSRNHIDSKSWKNFDSFESTVEDIPCLIAFTWAPAYRGARVDGLQIEPDEKEGIDEVYLFDRKGYRALWLDDLADKADCWDVITQEIYDHVREERIDADEYRAFSLLSRQAW